MSSLKSRVRFNFFENVAKYFCYFILVLFPLLYGPKHYADITEMKFKIFKNSAYIYFGICAVLLLYALFSRRQHIFEIRREEFKLKLTISQIAVVLYVIWSFISSFHSDFPLEKTKLGFGRYEGWLSALLYGAVFVCLSFWAEYQDNFAKCISVTVALFSIIGFMQFFKDGIIYPKGYTFWDAWFISTLGNVDMVGGYVAMTMPILFCTYILFKDKIWDYVLLGVMALFNFIFVMAEVDSGKVGLLAGLVFSIVFLADEGERIIRLLRALGTLAASSFFRFWFSLSKSGFNFNFGKKTIFMLLFSLLLFAGAWFLEKKKFSLKWSKKDVHRYFLLGLGCLIVLCLIVAFFYKGNNLLLKEFSELLHFRLSDEAGSGRGYIWKTSLKLAARKPFAGFGPGCFGEVYKDLDVLPTYTDFAHNDFIQIAVCTGFVGVEFYLFFCISLIVRAMKIMPDNKYVLILATSCVSYLVHSFFSFSIAIITPIFWVIAGLLDNLIRHAEVQNK